MVDENGAQETEVKDSAVEPSATDTHDTTTSPPASETTSGGNENENRVPHSRFNEVIEERNRERARANAVEARVRELEARQSAPQKVDHVAVIAKRLEERLNLKPEAALELAKAQDEISRNSRAESDAKMRQYEIAEWERNLQVKHADFKEQKPAMEKLFSEMSEQEKHLVVASPRGLEMLYRQAKAEQLESAAAKAFADGKDKAYQTKAEKKAVSTTPGTGAKTGSKLTQEAIRKMSNEEYKKRLPEINLAASRGEIE